MAIALRGPCCVITGYKLSFTGFKDGAGLVGLGFHLGHEFSLLSNLFLLLMGFALLSRHFEESAIPDKMPALLPDDWKGGVVLLGIVFVLSSFLDNIAAAIIGGTVARHVFRGKVHIGYLAAIVAASNAGGSGSVVGDTTTTMMWVAGVSPLSVLEAYCAAIVAFLIFAVPASLQQHRHSPIVKHARRHLVIDWTRVFIVAAMLTVALVVNVITNIHFPALLGRVPVLGLSVWAVLLLAAPLRRPDWAVMPETFKGTMFLLALVTAASMMPVEKLPAASWQTALGLGFVSAVFDNIPLTALALKQGGYDWGYLAYAVGFGGSIIWFGSSAGVALSNQYPEAKSVGLWLRAGWHVAIAYVIGFLVMLVLIGWHPDPILGDRHARMSAFGIKADILMFAIGVEADNSRCCVTLIEGRKVKCFLSYLDFLTTKAEPANSWRATKNGSSAVLMTAYFCWSVVFSLIWVVRLWRIIPRCQIFKTG